MYNKDLTPLSRRTWLRSGAAAAVVAAGCRTVPAARKAGRAEGCALPPVRVAPEREIRTIAGLRPFRPSGFVVRTENWGDTRIIHNYGHGGGGITLSWGTARLAVDMLPAGFRGPVGVLGCGVVGLATARLLQEAGLSVTIYARDLPPNTTSNVAGGQWFPFFVSDSRRRTPEFLRQLVAASEYAYRRFQVLVGSRYGVAWIRNYVLAQEPPPDDSLLGLHGPLRHLLPELKDLEPSEHPFSGFASVRQFDGMLIEPHIYLAALLEDIRAAGAVIRVGELSDRGALGGLPEKVLFNCTGLGAKALFGDDELTPVKGQLTFLLPQPEVRYAVLFGDHYMFPRSDGILLGGTHENGNWSLEPDLAARDRILQGHRRLFDNFRTC